MANLPPVATPHGKKNLMISALLRGGCHHCHLFSKNIREAEAA